MAGRLLALCKVVDKRLWGYEHPLKQFDLPFEVHAKIEHKNLSMDKLREMSADEIGEI